ncbi:tripartite tricarboxylate transporter TctB family protein [Billgrantia aerodenitrificans]|uniref:Tripartite tricarboxylate transporter TctB family protein n=1 Tax=Billgrantia aerodenitrificans TaxID=2733483 RepID=A0ABS9AWK9_9GAMM|nr:tripartite tricarboxylate transporter TctB family protein [Halomonas aerodenitrificans]MCE8026293.1 tripartite tricarboxylate transporter TctB family protein [Halomonas aerodenitrificans]
MSKKIERVQAGEKVFDWLLLLLSIGVLIEAYRIDGGLRLNSAGSFPVGLALVMLVSSLALIVSHRYKRRDESIKSALQECQVFLSDHFRSHIVVFSIAAIIYLAAIVWASFYISTFIFLAAMFIYFRQGRVVSSLIITTVAIAVIYVLFTVVFRVYLP